MLKEKYCLKNVTMLSVIRIVLGEKGFYWTFFDPTVTHGPLIALLALLLLCILCPGA